MLTHLDISDPTRTWNPSSMVPAPKVDAFSLDIVQAHVRDLSSLDNSRILESSLTEHDSERSSLQSATRSSHPMATRNTLDFITSCDDTSLLFSFQRQPRKSR